MATDQVPRIVIVGGGFGGLTAARVLRNTPAQVILIDHANHHLFQALLYQVATGVLTPGQIASPIRGILRHQKNTTVIMGDVTGVDKGRKCVFAGNADREDVPVAYDYLILATGARTSYFGRPELERFAPGLATLADAVAIRNKIMGALEQAEAEEDASRHRDLLTFVLVGAGPTGVEMAGALAWLVRTTLRSEFRRIRPESARIILVDMAGRVLGAFSEKLSMAARRRLEYLGVEVRLGKSVDLIDEAGVVIGGERIPSRAVIWAAGVTASPAGKWLDAEVDRVGRVRVQKDLSVPGHPDIFVVGDTASFDRDGTPLPGVAQVAIQQGRYAGRLVHARVTGSPTPAPFHYFDKGIMAVVGKGFAVLESGRLRVAGFPAWLVWVAVHVLSLAESYLKTSVLMQWVWTYATTRRGSQLIVDHCKAERANTDRRP